MPVLTPIKKEQSKVHPSQYILSEDKPDEADPKPAAPESPENPETK